MIAAANITKIMDVDLAQAKAMKQKTQVDDDDLVEYFKGYNTIGCYFIEEPKFFQSVIQLEELREKWFFYPPQSFISLSREAVEWLTCKSSSTPT